MHAPAHNLRRIGRRANFAAEFDAIALANAT